MHLLAGLPPAVVCPKEEFVAQRLPAPAADETIGVWNPSTPLANTVPFASNSDSNCSHNVALFALLANHPGDGLEGDLRTLWENLHGWLRMQKRGNKRDVKAQVEVNTALVAAIIAGVGLSEDQYDVRTT